MSRTRYQQADFQSPHFLTATINNWLPVFTRPETVDIVLDSWRFLPQTNGFEIFGYVILENHLHLIARSPNLSGDIQRFKAYTAKEILAYLEAKGESTMLRLFEHFKHPQKKESAYQEWEEGSHPQVIVSEEVQEVVSKFGIWPKVEEGSVFRTQEHARECATPPAR
jgi:putative transposase